MEKEIRLQPIGYVKNNQIRDPKKKNWAEIKSKIILNPELVDALEGIEEYPYIIVIFWLNLITERGRRIKKLSCRKINRKTVGVLASRVPFRPNPVGITTVKLIKRKKNTLIVKGLDAFDGTPVLDIKPYTGFPKDLVPDSEK